MRYFTKLITDEHFAWYKAQVNAEIEKTEEEKREEVEQALEEQVEAFLSLPATDLFNLQRNLMNFPTIRPLYEKLYQSTSKEYADRFIKDIQKKLGVDVDRDRILLAVAQSTASFLAFGLDSAINSVDRTGNKLVEGYINEMMNEGVTDVDAAKKKIRDSYKLVIASRSMRIGRTEIATAANRASWVAARSLGIPLAKVWDSVIDSRTRATPEWNHVENNRQIQKLNDYFVVSGERLKYPLDPVASLGNRINCRCAMFFTSVDAIKPVEEVEADT